MVFQFHCLTRVNVPIDNKPRERKLPEKKRSRECRICGKVLYDLHSLKKHEDVVHFNLRPHECTKCLKRFSVKNDLHDHVNAVHKKIKVAKYAC